eukprot:GHVS01060616.1.p1 GENE.GHVS01060616.1~~GHVS01060616.1.p1  ORF type:complete len:339 (+),score=39.08 GHVS01060616.1:197-1213(+)
MTEVVDDMKVKHEDAVASSSRHLLRTSHEYAHIYVKSSLRVFWAICLLFLFNMAMPAKSIEFKQDNGDEIKEQLSQIENGAAEFKNKGFILTTYGDIEGSPIPVLRYLKALEKAVNPGSGTPDVEFDRMDIAKRVKKFKELGVTKTTFEVVKDMGVAASAVLVITNFEFENGDIVVGKKYRASAFFEYKTSFDKYLVRLILEHFEVKEEDGKRTIGDLHFADYMILEHPSVFVQHVMSYALGGAYTTDTYMAAVRFPEGVMLIAAGVFCDGKTVSGKIIAPTFVLPLEAHKEKQSSPVDTIINFLNKDQDDERVIKWVEEPFAGTWVKKTFGKDTKTP